MEQHVTQKHIAAMLGADVFDPQLWHKLEQFEQLALEAIVQSWPFEDHTHYYWDLTRQYTTAERETYAARLEAACTAIYQQLGEHTGHLAAVFWLHPHLWNSQRSTNISGSYQPRRNVEHQLLDSVAEACIQRWKPADLTQQLLQRFAFCCTRSASTHNPNGAQLLSWLLAHEDATAEPVLQALCAGDFAQAYTCLGLDAQQAVLDHEKLLSIVKNHTIALLERLYKRSELTNERFSAFCSVFEGTLQQHVTYYLYDFYTDQHQDPEQHAFADTLHELYDARIWPLVLLLHPEDWPLLAQLRYIRGGKYLLSIADHTEQSGLSRLHGNHLTAPFVLQQLLQVLKRHSTDQADELIGVLRQFQATTLLALLPHTKAYRDEIIAALDWAGCEPFLQQLEQLEASHAQRSTDPRAGVIHHRELKDLLEQLEPTARTALIETFRPYAPTAVTYFEAVSGINRAAIRRGFGRRTHLAARVLPLLPFSDKDTVVERYLALTRFEKAANSSPAGRKAYERAAAQAGLANLALHAGYADATRLEWAMQARLGAEHLQLGRTWEIEGYTVTLGLRNHEPALEVANSKRILKRTPAKVRRHYDYQAIKATFEQAKDQYRRYRNAFLHMMRLGHTLSPEEQQLLRESPVASSILERLVVLDAAGACGLYRAGDHALEGVYGERVPISGAISIAHPLHLAELDLLRDWQRAIVQHQLVQPFKQLFREQYVLTPAEAEAGYSSARLAGRRMKGRQALAVLANLNWVTEYGGSVEKRFYEQGLVARFQTNAFDYYNTDDASTTGMLEFWPLQRGYSHEEERIALADIPRLIFSEVVRDLDLVTIIAHQEDEYSTSREVQQQRANVARLIFDSLGLTSVSVVEPWVHVQGSRANYRIQLATGAIHLDSGQYLCIVPSAKQQQAVYLPFEQSGDSVLSEIISKALLLANDRVIKDQTILAQL